MKLSFRLSEKLNWLFNTIYFFKRHFKVLFGLGFIAAFGRAIQLGAFGQVSSLMNIFLELMIESSRILIFMYVLGVANIKSGALRIRHLITHKNNRKLNRTVALQKLKSQWLTVLLNIILFLIIAWTVNYLIDLLAYETCLYITLKKDGIIAESATQWTIILFFKNLSVIPFTLIFYGVFLLWITDKFKSLSYSKQ
jgi:hypothetical protein